MLPERDFYSFLIILFIKLVFIFLKIIARVAADVIIIIILRNFIANNFLHIGGEFSAVHKRAGI